MKRVWNYLRTNPISFLLLAIPFAFLGEYRHWSPVLVFALSALAVIPLASLIGKSTEVLAHHSGPRLGGLLNATFGNAAELIITIVAIQKGLLELVKASITGSILGNLLFVLGMSMLVGGIKHGEQKFDRHSASRNSILLVLTVLILLIPSVFSHYIGAIDPQPSLKVEALNLGVALVMIVLYLLGLLYGFRFSGGPLTTEKEEITDVRLSWSLTAAILILGASTIGVALLSELFVEAVEPVVLDLGISEFFIGIIFIPIIGNIAEHLVAVQVAIKNKMTLSVEIAVASSLQVALFVAPVLIFLSPFLGHPLTLVFNQLELLALIAGVLIAALVSEDGISNWLEGAELLAIYFVLGLAFLLL